MPYIDTETQCTFERKTGESLLDPEHYTCTCACGKTVNGKNKNRDIQAIAKTHGWALLPQTTGNLIAYCSVACAYDNQRELVVKHVFSLMNQRLAIQAELTAWHKWSKEAE
jgi:hypothetical protein